MSKRQKLIDKLKRRPRNFTFDEADSLLLSLGFKKFNLGKTSGSRLEYRIHNAKYRIHKPHPQKELQPYQLLQLLQVLEKEGLI
jgi:hypothetical protein